MLQGLSKIQRRLPIYSRDVQGTAFRMFFALVQPFCMSLSLGELPSLSSLRRSLMSQRTDVNIRAKCWDSGITIQPSDNSECTLGNRSNLETDQSLFVGRFFWDSNSVLFSEKNFVLHLWGLPNRARATASSDVQITMPHTGHSSGGEFLGSNQLSTLNRGSRELSQQNARSSNKEFWHWFKCCICPKARENITYSLFCQTNSVQAGGVSYGGLGGMYKNGYHTFTEQQNKLQI